MRRVLCTTAAVGVLGLGVTVAWAEDRALLVGVGAYARQEPFRDLPGNDANIGIMREVAAHLGFADEQIRVIEDEAATLVGVRRAFEDWLIEAVGPDDRALFYFSGYDHYVRDRDGDERDGRDEVLVMHDYAGTPEALTNVLVDDEMNGLLARLRTDDTLIFLDASFFDDDDQPGERVMSRGPGNGVRYMGLGAARAGEVAFQSREGGFFTRGVLAAVRESAATDSPLTMNTIREMASTEILRLATNGAGLSIPEPVLTGDLARADYDLRRRGPAPRSFSRRLVAAVESAPSRVGVSGARSVAAAGQALAAQRLALVIGNATYAEPAMSLAYPVNDAQAMAAILEELGFTVTVETDADIVTMVQAANRFIGQVRSGDVALFYYSGIGFEVDGGNYLASVDLSLDHNLTQARVRSLAASELLEQMAEAGARARLVILDASRSNPFERTQTLTSGGLAAMVGRGGLVAFAVEAGGDAMELSGDQNGLFTKHLLEALEESGVPHRELFAWVRMAVYGRVRRPSDAVDI